MLFENVLAGVVIGVFTTLLVLASYFGQEWYYRFGKRVISAWWERFQN